MNKERVMKLIKELVIYSEEYGICQGVGLDVPAESHRRKVIGLVDKIREELEEE